MSSMPENHVRALVLGDYRFLQKPFNVPQMLALIEAAAAPRSYLRVIRG